MHKFPKDANLRRQWVKLVQVKREDFVKPTEHSVICNVHFTTECYEKSFMVEMALKKQKQLIPGAVPTVQSPGANNYSEVRKRPRRSRSAEKLEISRVSRKTLQLLILVIYRKYM